MLGTRLQDRAIEISKLRREAERALGSRFDVKKFHRVLLIDGPLPMSVLAMQVRDWIARENLTLAQRPRNGSR